MAAHLSPASWHAAITSFPLCREALATTICLRPSGYQLRIFLEGARQCWHLLLGSSWAAGLWASLNPLSSPPQGDVYVSLPVWEPSAQKNKFSRCLALSLEEMEPTGKEEVKAQGLKNPSLPWKLGRKGAGLKARRVCKATGLMATQLSGDLALARFKLQGESLADLSVVTRVMSSWLWSHISSGPLPLYLCSGRMVEKHKASFGPGFLFPVSPV